MLALCFLTFAAFTMPSRYETIGTTGILDWGPADDSSQLGGSGRERTSGSASNDGVRLAAGNGKVIPAVYFPLPDMGNAEFVRANVDVLAERIVPGLEPWQVARVLVLSFDFQARMLTHWPKEVASLSGDSDWSDRQLIVPTAGEVAQLRLVAYNAATSGTIGIRNLSAEQLTERPIFVAFRIGLLLVWVAVGIWCLATLFRAPGRAILKVMTVTVVALIVASALVPQPRFDQLTRPAHDWLAAISGPVLASAGTQLSGATTGAEVNPPPGVSGAGKAGSGSQDRQSNANDRLSISALTIAVPEGQQVSVGTTLVTFEELIHFSSFAILAALILLTYQAVPLTVAVGFPLLAAAATECLQLFLVTRSFEWQDLLVDWVGVAVGAAIAVAWMTVRRSWGGVARHAG